MRKLAVSLAVLIAACTPGGDISTAETGPPDAPSAPPDSIEVTIESIIDGDSLRVMIDGESVEIRLLGINAPERNECWSNEARALLTEAAAGVDTSIVPGETDQYGRLLAYLYVGKANVNRELVAAGSALALALEHDQLPDFLAAEEEAIALERGLWSPTACGSGPDRLEVRIWTVEPDAPGRDDRNPNGEFVAVTNDGPPADLSGWGIRDESSRHRYTFPDGFILGTGEIITIRSGCGQDAPPDLYWCADGPVWTNSGDTVLLLDGFGAVMDRVRYLED